MDNPSSRFKIYPSRIENERYRRELGQKRRKMLNDKKQQNAISAIIDNPTNQSFDLMDIETNDNDSNSVPPPTNDDDNYNINDEDNLFNEETHPYMFCNFEGGGGGVVCYVFIRWLVVNKLFYVVVESLSQVDGVRK
jgi:hypothetical protein